VRTLVVSDLHLGSRTDADVLRRAGARDALAGALDGVDRLVLLGDVLELRHGPIADAIDTARPALAAIAGALRPGAEVLLLAGNHDHALVAPFLEQRAFERAGPLALEQRFDPAGSPATAAIAEALAPARVEVAYPGAWLRDDVYATHGHYLDVHVTTPTFERLGTGFMRRFVGGAWPPGAPDDYEAILAPLYAWLHVVARSTRSGFGAERQRGTQSAWKLLTGRERARSLRGRAAVAGFPVAVAALNRLGVGPVGPDLSPVELRRSGLRAMHEAVRRLGIDASWVLFGHTHRAGPRDGDDRAEWGAGRGTRLMNTGSWVYEEVFLDDPGGRGADGGGPDRRRSPYWPGSAIVLGDDGPPELVNLLPDLRP
jgi:UDP-2,3-diacylglucosamine pyrophosphatase LpxH